MQPHRDGVKQTKVHVNLKLVKDVKDNRKGLYKYNGGKRKSKEHAVTQWAGEISDQGHE